jgi:hypothetical protein
VSSRQPECRSLSGTRPADLCGACAIRTTRGLFVPKPSRGADCQGCDMPDLGTSVRQRPLASAAGGSDCYSLGYSAPGRLRLDHLDANYRRFPLLVRPRQLTRASHVSGSGFTEGRRPAGSHRSHLRRDAVSKRLAALMFRRGCERAASGTDARSVPPVCATYWVRAASSERPGTATQARCVRDRHV